VEFKKRFQNVNNLIQQNKQIGEAAILGPFQQRFVYYLITKEHYYHKPTYESLQATLLYTRDHAVKNGVKSISMPRLGCGLDGLLWPQVRSLLQEVFSDTGITLTVFTL